MNRLNETKKNLKTVSLLKTGTMILIFVFSGLAFGLFMHDWITEDYILTVSLDKIVSLLFLIGAGGNAIFQKPLDTAIENISEEITYLEKRQQEDLEEQKNKEYEQFRTKLFQENPQTEHLFRLWEENNQQLSDPTKIFEPKAESVKPEKTQTTQEENVSMSLSLQDIISEFKGYEDTTTPGVIKAYKIGNIPVEIIDPNDPRVWAVTDEELMNQVVIPYDVKNPEQTELTNSRNSRKRTRKGGQHLKG